MEKEEKQSWKKMECDKLPATSQNHFGSMAALQVTTDFSGVRYQKDCKN